MTLYTSYFAKIKQLREMGYDNLVCVAGYPPKFFYDVKNARFYPNLAPKKEWFWEWKSKFQHDPNCDESVSWYIHKYCQTVLDQLDPQTVLKDLGNKAVMLCYETPEKFCHRHIIAKWLEKNTDASVQEVIFD